MKKHDKIETIRLKGVLPKAFENAGDSEPIKTSEIWLADFTFRRGEFYLVEAESGTGKSSLCSFIYGNRNDYSGSIFFNETDSRKISAAERSLLRRESLALLPQEMRLFPELTVYENIDIKNRLTGFKSAAEITSLMEATGIAEFKDRRADTLSIGQQQRVAIVRTVCQPFDFMLLDEPVSHLDSKNNRLAAEILTAEAVRQGAAIIATSVGNKIMLDNIIPVKL